jgi:hypothetical protein
MNGTWIAIVSFGSLGIYRECGAFPRFWDFAASAY